MPSVLQRISLDNTLIIMPTAKSIFQYWPFITQFALYLFLCGGAWKGFTIVANEVAELKHARAIDYRLLIELNANAVNRDRLIQDLRDDIRDLRRRLEDKKIVADILPKVNVAGEAYNVKK